MVISLLFILPSIYFPMDITNNTFIIIVACINKFKCLFNSTINREGVSDAHNCSENVKRKWDSSSLKMRYTKEFAARVASALSELKQRQLSQGRAPSSAQLTTIFACDHFICLFGNSATDSHLRSRSTKKIERFVLYAFQSFIVCVVVDK